MGQLDLDFLLNLNIIIEMKSLSNSKIQYLSESDKYGRCSFMLTWMVYHRPGEREGGHGWREHGQCFKSDPRKYGHPRPEDVPVKRSPQMKNIK